MNDCTIDVWVLKTIRCCGDEYHNCTLFLEILLYCKCKVCIDNEGIIFNYYNDLVDWKNPSDLIGQWWKTIQLRNLKPVEPRITDGMHRDLLKLKFDQDDLIYVEVANSSIDKNIITGDSDFGCNPISPKNKNEIKIYLKENRINAITPKEAVDELIKNAKTSKLP